MFITSFGNIPIKEANSACVNRLIVKLCAIRIQPYSLRHVQIYKQILDMTHRLFHTHH